MKVGLNFGITLYEYDPDDAVTIAQRAEALGFQSLWAGDHLILPPEIPLRDVATPDLDIKKVSAASPTAKRIFEPDAPMPEPLVFFAHLAGATRSIIFGSDIYILPLRNPMVTARAAATLDHYSGGRFLFGIGLGWLREELELAGVEWKSRGRRTDEYIRVMRTLWEDDEPAYDGEFISFGPSKFEPKPHQKPSIPILVGGESGPALRRVAALGDGWCARFHTPQALRDNLAHIHALREEYSRAHLPFIVATGGRRTDTVEDVRAQGEAGADHLFVSMHGLQGLDTVLTEMERYAETVLARL